MKKRRKKNYFQKRPERATCPICGKIYNLKYNALRVCSIECQQKYLFKKYGYRRCEICNKKFIPKNAIQKYCSRKCAKISNDQQLFERQKITNFDIFMRDSFTCQYCGKTPDDGIKLVVDHIWPIEKGGKSEFQNLITACTDCNGKKYNKMMPKHLILELWDKCVGEFKYEETKRIWKLNHKHRKQRIKKIIQNN